MAKTYRPDIHDFFPKLRRGHGGIRHRRGKEEPPACFGKSGHCVAESCNTRTEKGELHIDPAKNAADWKEEHGFHKDTPLEYCYKAEYR